MDIGFLPKGGIACNKQGEKNKTFNKTTHTIKVNNFIAVGNK